MSYNGSGTFSINSAGQPVITGTVISSTAFNALTADLATGLSTAITKDGQTTTTARILFAQGVSSTLVTDATSATTGSIITAGGISMQKALWVGTTATVTGATTMAAATFSGNVDINKSVPVLSFTGTEGSAKKWSLIENAGVFYIQDTTTSVNLLSMTNTTLTVTGSLSVTSTSTLSGTLTAAAANFSGTVALTGAGGMTLTNAQNGFTGTQITNSSAGASAYTGYQLNNGSITGGIFLGGTGNADPNLITVAANSGGSVRIQPTGGSGITQFYSNGAESARISAAGLVGIGMTPVNVLDITQSQNANSHIAILNNNAGGLALADLYTSNGSTTTQFGTLGTGFTTSGALVSSRGFVYCSGAPGLAIIAGAGPLVFAAGSANEAARIDSSGNLLVGTTSSPSGSNSVKTNGKLISAGGCYVNGAAIAGWNADAGFEAVQVNDTQTAVSGYATGATQASAFRARVDTDTGNLINFYRSTVQAGRFISTGGGTPNIQWLAVNQAYVIAGGSGGVTLASAATAWAAVSDETLKTDLALIQSGAEKVASLRAVTGRYKTDAESMSRSFLIAQDVQKVLPEAVSTDADGTLSLRYTEVIPLMVAAIQELTTRLAALENK